MTLFREKMLISTRGIIGFMPKLIKKSVTVSTAKPYLSENFLSIENYVGIFIFVAIKLFCGRFSDVLTE